MHTRMIHHATTEKEIARQRLSNHHIAGTRFSTPAEVVQWLCAVQAQDYTAAKWAIGQRTRAVTDAGVEQAFAVGAILRTHVLRPTWHFVTAADIRWMLELTAPRVRAATEPYNRRHELDAALFKRSNAVLAKALRGGKQLTRVELASILSQAGIATDDLLRLMLIMMRAELDGIVCSGAPRGKQQTYALLDERAPKHRALARDEALAELARRYFAGHGPATLQDYAWWSGLTIADARSGLAMVQSAFAHEEVNGKTYWLYPSRTAKDKTLAAYLLPNFDEYMVGYTHRGASYDQAHDDKLDARGSILATHTIVIDGEIVGAWKRTFRKNALVFTTKPFRKLTSAETRATSAAATRYGKFLDLPLISNP